MAVPSARYQPRRPAEDVLHQIVRAHFETFLAQAASLRDGEPAWVNSSRMLRSWSCSMPMPVLGAEWDHHRDRLDVSGPTSAYREALRGAVPAATRTDA